MMLLPDKFGRRVADRVLRRPFAIPPEEQRVLIERSEEATRDPASRTLPPSPTSQQKRVFAGNWGGDQWGLLTVSRARSAMLPSGFGFHCTCMCGRQVVLKASEVLFRYDAGIGCGLADCPSPHGYAKAWYDLDAAFRLQVAQAAAVWEPFLETLSDDVTIDEVASAWKALYQGYNQETGKWWLRGFRDLDPARTTFGRVPNSALFPGRQVMMRISGEVYTLQEASLALSTPALRLEWMKLKYWDWQIIERIMEERVSGQQ